MTATRIAVLTPRMLVTKPAALKRTVSSAAPRSAARPSAVRGQAGPAPCVCECAVSVIVCQSTPSAPERTDISNGGRSATVQWLVRSYGRISRDIAERPSTYFTRAAGQQPVATTFFLDQVARQQLARAVVDCRVAGISALRAHPVDDPDVSVITRDVAARDIRAS